MKVAFKTLLAGVLLMVFCGNAIAHGRHHRDWSGGLTIAVAPSGHLSWSGALNHGPVAVYPRRHALVPVVVVEPRYRRLYRHPSYRHHGHRHDVYPRYYRHPPGAGYVYKKGKKRRVVYVYDDDHSSDD